MTPATLTALRGSIAKWQAIVDGHGVDQSCDNCPLCALFWDRSSCAGCPVSAKSGEHGCSNTPYEAWSDAEDDLGISGEPINSIDDPAAREKLRAAAQAELDFLISLLPEGEAP